MPLAILGEWVESWFEAWGIMPTDCRIALCISPERSYPRLFMPRPFFSALSDSVCGERMPDRECERFSAITIHAENVRNGRRGV